MPSSSSATRQPRSLREILDAYERVVLIQAVQASGGSRARAASALGISRSNLYARLHRLRVDMAVMPARVGRPRKELTP